MDSPTLKSGPVAPPVGVEAVNLNALRDEDERRRRVWPPNPEQPDIPQRIREEFGMDYRPLKGQKALVTGANSGIRGGIARALTTAGAAVVVNAESARRVADDIKPGS